jgi:hypothetical protein
MGALVALSVATLISSFISNCLASHEVVYQSQVSKTGADELR